MKRIDKILASGNIPTAAIYARFSSDNQREESIDAQLRACREYADRNHIKVVGEYIDRAKSATTSENRSGFLAMIGNADKFDFVLVHKLDRFARNRSDSIGYRMELKRHNTTLISVIENLDEDNPESIILESVLEGMNEYYSRNLAREVRKGLNENGMKTKLGKPFGKNSLHDILRNEKYCGVYVYNRAQAKTDNKRNNHKSKPSEDIIRIENGIPAIISKETFERVQEILNRRANKTPTSAAKEVYLLSGKIYFGECGAVYCGNRHNCGRSKTTMVTYRCNNRTTKTNITCKNKEVNKKYIEAFVLKVLSDIIFDEKYVPNIIKDYNTFTLNNSSDMAESAAVMKKEISRMNGKISNLTNVIAETGNASLVTALSKLEKERDNITEKLEALTEKMKAVKIPNEEINAAFVKAKAMFQSGTLAETRQLINLYVEKVVVYPDRVDLRVNPINFMSNILSAGDNAQLSKIPVENFAEDKSITRKSLNMGKNAPIPPR